MNACRWAALPSGVRRRPPRFGPTWSTFRTTFLLSLENPGGAVSRDLSLRIDPALFDTLWSITGGLPRHLINPGELNRLDTFIDRLCRAPPAPEPLPEFLIYNADRAVLRPVGRGPAPAPTIQARGIVRPV